MSIEVRLDEADLKLIALGFLGLMMRQGPVSFDLVLRTAKKLSISSEVENYANSFIGYTEKEQK